MGIHAQHPRSERLNPSLADATPGFLSEGVSDDVEMHWEHRLRHLAGEQGGVVGIDQIGSIEVTGSEFGRARRNGRWRPLSPRVLALEGTAATDEQRAMAAVLDAGGASVLHGGSTLAMVGLSGFDLSVIDVARRHGGRTGPSRLARVHHLRDLHPTDVTVVRGVPTVTPLRAIWSEASRFSAKRWYEVGFTRIGRLLDEANRRRLVTWAALHASIERLGRSGRAGTRLMRALAEERLPGASVTESRNEDRFEEIVGQTEMPPFARQVVVGDATPLGRADFRDQELALVAEVNSMTYHSLPTDRAADERRYAAMNRAGFTVAVIWEGDLWSRPANVVATTLEARRLARRREAITLHSHGCPWPHDPSRRVVRVHQPVLRG